MNQLLFAFPELNKWSSPLLFLSLQGLVFASLLIYRWINKKNTSDILLASMLLIMCYHQTTYTIGFMGWYDTFRNTKINYYLIALSLASAPILYLYVVSITTSGFKLLKKHIIHFIPWILYFVYHIFILVYDAAQPGFEETQNGVLKEGLNDKYVEPFYIAFLNVQQILYAAFTVQLFYNYRRKINQYYADNYKLELNWVRNFLIIYIALFIYSIVETLIDVIITDLYWTQMWWYHFLAALAILYIGIKGYFTKTSHLQDLEFNDFSSLPNPNLSKEANLFDYNYDKEVEKIKAMFASEKPYLDAEINLKSLSKKLNYTPARLSEIVNNGFGLNFNDFINGYRVEEVKSKLIKGEQASLSLVAIAMDSGFNSKATFNRVFKKLTGDSPSAFMYSLKK